MCKYLLLGILIIAPSMAQGKGIISPEYYGPKKKIIVSDFEVNLKNAPVQSGQVFTAQLKFALFHTNRFVVKEEGSSGNGFAQAAIKGKIRKCGEEAVIKWIDLALPARFKGPKVTSAWIVVDINLSDPNTGVIIKSFRVKAETKLSGEKLAGLDREKLNPDWNSSALCLSNDKVITRIIGVIIEEMDKYKWEARITRIEGNKIYIDGGLESNLKAGTMLAVHKRNNAETIVGEIKVIEVNKDFSMALITKNAGIKSEMSVRMVE
ncbi:MAG: hypothetical protein QME42_09345 [bacterium]|nr:hypothetical protein [bacterium]